MQICMLFFSTSTLKKNKNYTFVRNLHWYRLRSNCKIRLIGSRQLSMQERKEVVSTKTHFIRAHERFKVQHILIAKQLCQRKVPAFQWSMKLWNFWSHWNFASKCFQNNVVSFRSFSFWVATYLCMCVCCCQPCQYFQNSRIILVQSLSCSNCTCCPLTRWFILISKTFPKKLLPSRGQNWCWSNHLLRSSKRRSMNPNRITQLRRIKNHLRWGLCNLLSCHLTATRQDVKLYTCWVSLLFTSNSLYNLLKQQNKHSAKAQWTLPLYTILGRRFCSYVHVSTELRSFDRMGSTEKDWFIGERVRESYTCNELQAYSISKMNRML